MLPSSQLSITIERAIVEHSSNIVALGISTFLLFNQLKAITLNIEDTCMNLSAAEASKLSQSSSSWLLEFWPSYQLRLVLLQCLASCRR